MKLMKKLIVAILVISMLTMMLAGCGQEAPKTDDPAATKAPVSKKDITLSIAGTSGATDTQSMAHVDFADRLNKLGGWKAEAKINGVMGETDDVTEQALQGVPVVNSSDPGRMASYVNDYGLLAMPYLFPDYTYLNTVMDTETYKGWEEDFRAQGIELLTSNCYSGTRSLIGPDVYEKPADLKGIQLRTIGTPAYLGTIEAMGASAVALAWGDTYQGIELGTVDGTEAQIPGIYSMKFYEVCDTISLSEHFILIGSIFVGTSWFDTLDAADQANLIKTAREAYGANQELVNTLSNDYIEEMKSEYGVTVAEIDKTAFIEATEPVYDDLGYTELRDQLFAELGL